MTIAFVYKALRRSVRAALGNTLGFNLLASVHCESPCFPLSIFSRAVPLRRAVVRDFVDLCNLHCLLCSTEPVLDPLVFAPRQELPCHSRLTLMYPAASMGNDLPAVHLQMAYPPCLAVSPAVSPVFPLVDRAPLFL